MIQVRCEVSLKRIAGGEVQEKLLIIFAKGLVL
jgi:hypothetical protein